MCVCLVCLCGPPVPLQFVHFALRMNVYVLCVAVCVVVCVWQCDSGGVCVAVCARGAVLENAVNCSPVRCSAVRACECPSCVWLCAHGCGVAEWVAECVQQGAGGRGMCVTVMYVRDSEWCVCMCVCAYVCV